MQLVVVKVNTWYVHLGCESQQSVVQSDVSLCSLLKTTCGNHKKLWRLREREQSFSFVVVFVTCESFKP